MVWRAASIHEGLGDNTEAGVDDVRLAKVEHKVRVLDQVHPESAKNLVRKGPLKETQSCALCLKSFGCGEEDAVFHIWIWLGIELWYFLYIVGIGN